MPSLIRFVIVNFAAGSMLGLVVMGALFLGGGGPLSALGAASDRLLALAMLAFAFASTFGLGCLGTALCFFPDD